MGDDLAMENIEGALGENVCTNFVPLQLEDVAFWEFEGLCFYFWFWWLGRGFIDASSNATVSVCRIDVCCVCYFCLSSYIERASSLLRPCGWGKLGKEF